MLKKSFLATVVSVCVAACGGGADVTLPVERHNGTLGMLPAIGNFDFNNIPVGHLPYSTLTEWQTHRLEAKFMYEGTPGVLEVPQHVVLNYSQANDPTRPVNAAGDVIFSHGAGVIATERGLGLELWFMDTGGSNAYVWDQNHGRCMQVVNGTVPDGTMCLLPDAVDDGAYMTAAPNFQLKRGTTYILRMSLTPAKDGWVIMEGQLWEEQPIRDGVHEVLVQRGRIGFQYATFFPNPAKPLVPVIARTPGNPTEQTVRYLVSTGGF